MPTTQETGAPSLPAGSAQLKHYRNPPFSLLSSFPAAPPPKRGGGKNNNTMLEPTRDQVLLPTACC